MLLAILSLILRNSRLPQIRIDSQEVASQPKSRPFIPGSRVAQNPYSLLPHEEGTHIAGQVIAARLHVRASTAGMLTHDGHQMWRAVMGYSAD
jgi:hypothetical protein